MSIRVGEYMSGVPFQFVMAHPGGGGAGINVLGAGLPGAVVSERALDQRAGPGAAPTPPSVSCLGARHRVTDTERLRRGRQCLSHRSVD